MIHSNTFLAYRMLAFLRISMTNNQNCLQISLDLQCHIIKNPVQSVKHRSMLKVKFSKFTLKIHGILMYQ